MNISFHHKVAIGLLVLAGGLISLWRYDFRVQEPRHQYVMSSLQDDLRERDELTGILDELSKIKTSFERVTVHNQVDATAAPSIRESLSALAVPGEKIFNGKANAFKQLAADTDEFFKIAGQLQMYETKLTEFTQGFESYVKEFEKTVNTWSESATASIASGKPVANTIPFSELEQKVTALEKAIPELSSFEQQVKALSTGFDQLITEINAAGTPEEKQALLDKKKYLVQGIPELSDTFKKHIRNASSREQSNVVAIAGQIRGSMTEVIRQVEEKFAAKNNAVQTIMAQTKYKDEQYRKVKYVVAALTFVAILAFFFAITMYAFRFERGLAFFRRKTFEAAQASREVSASLKDTSDLAVQNFDLANTLKDGLTDVSKGFLARQNNLQHIDHLVRDTETLLKESQQNFLHIKEEFTNAEKVSEEIVHLTQALEGVAVQMTTVAERVESAPAARKHADAKSKTVDELRYLAGRIRYAVNATHATLDGRAAKIAEAKTQFTLIEDNMVQMTENTKQALRGLALARLDHSEEVSRINEILEKARSNSRSIVSEIESLNKQINDFSVLSKHLAALHDLAVKASALNTQSLLTEENAPLVEETITSSQRMNTYVQEYFKKIFELPALKIEQEQTTEARKVNRIEATSADV